MSKRRFNEVVFIVTSGCCDDREMVCIVRSKALAKAIADKLPDGRVRQQTLDPWRAYHILKRRVPWEAVFNASGELKTLAPLRYTLENFEGEVGREKHFFVYFMAVDRKEAEEKAPKELNKWLARLSRQESAPPRPVGFAAFSGMMDDKEILAKLKEDE